jgi:hypothetical protein
VSDVEGRHFAPSTPEDAAEHENDLKAAGQGCPECGWQPDPDDKRHPAVAIGLHRRLVHGVQGEGKHKKKTPGGDTPPRSQAPQVNINLSAKPGGKKKDPVLDAVQARAEWVAGMVAVALLLAGQPADASDIEKGKGKWAESVRELAVYEDWLRRLGEGGEASDRMMAWVKFLAATLSLSLPILLRHGAIPPAIARMLEMAAPPAGVEGAPTEPAADVPLAA